MQEQADLEKAMEYYEEMAKANLTDDQKKRRKNPYLYENQVLEDEMNDLLDWL